MPQSFTHEKIQVSVADSSLEMAELAAADLAAEVNRLAQASTDDIHIVFAGAESQQEFHKALVRRSDIDWTRIQAFAVDEFYAPGIPAEYAVSRQPRRDLYDHVPIKAVHILDFAAADPEAERARFEKLIEQHPLHIACMGIGESGHLAFNEPGQTDFNDPLNVRIIEVCDASKAQLEKDPNFMKLGQIPSMAITMTVPPLMKAPAMFVVVPYRNKAKAVQRFFESDVTPDFPATIVKRKEGARLYLDTDSYSLCSA